MQQYCYNTKGKMADRITNKTVSVGTSPVVIAQELLDGQRKSISIVNTSTGGQKISLSIGQEPVSGAGFVMSAGGSYIDSTDGIVYPPNYQFAVISDLAGGTVSVIERIGGRID